MREVDGTGMLERKKEIEVGFSMLTKPYHKHHEIKTVALSDLENKYTWYSVAVLHYKLLPVKKTYFISFLHKNLK